MRLLMSKQSETMGTSCHRGKVRPDRSEGIALVQRTERYSNFKPPDERVADRLRLRFAKGVDRTAAARAS